MAQVMQRPAAAVALSKPILAPTADVQLTNKEMPVQSEEYIASRIPSFPYSHILDNPSFGDWRDELRDNGYVVIKEAIPAAKALEYRDKAFDWLAGHGYGFNKNDPSTYTQEHLPMHARGGMYAGGAYGFAQSNWVWQIKCEPGVVGAFEKLWGTPELVTSFDGGSLMLPTNLKLTGSDASWPHVDQCPHRKGHFLTQGIVNLNYNDDEDGGLIVMEGSSRLIKKFFEIHGFPPLPETDRIDWHLFSEDDKKWFEDQECTWKKVNAGPGDLILWDSNTMHQNRPPSLGARDRMAVYVCMGPAHLVTEEDKRVRDLAFKTGDGTTHPPFHGAYSWTRKPEQIIRPETGKPDPLFMGSIDPVKPTEQILKLAGVIPY